MIRLGIVGCGRILAAHLEGFRILREKGYDSNFRITALCARSLQDAQAYQQPNTGFPPRKPPLPPESGDPLAVSPLTVVEFQSGDPPKCFDDHRAMLASGCVDAVLDTTMVGSHHEVAMACFEAGVHVLEEKPLAITVRAAERMVKEAELRKVKFGVCEVVRYAELTRQLGWLMRSDLIGAPQMYVGGGLGSPWSPNRICADTPWRHRKLTAGGGCTIDLGVHAFHFMHYVIGDIGRIYAKTRMFEEIRRSGELVVECNVDDAFMAIVTFLTDAIGTQMFSWAGHGPPCDFGGPVIYGSKGCFKEDRVFFNGDPEPRPLTELFEERCDAATKAQFFPRGIKNVFALNELDWLKAIEVNRWPETAGVDGLYDLACAYALCESSAANRSVTPEEVISGKASVYQRALDRYHGLLPRRHAHAMRQAA